MISRENGVLLHCCCGPCALYPLEVLRRDGYEVAGFFDNPNIHPYREFLARKESFRTMAESQNLLAVIESEYGLKSFLTTLGAYGADLYEPVSEARCALCYRMRLDKAAAFCAKVGLNAFSTTLLVSPYQRHELIRLAGEEAAAARGLTFLYRDFRPGFRQGQAAARETGLYMQGYCGCIFSEYERYGAKVPERGIPDEEG